MFREILFIAHSCCNRHGERVILAMVVPGVVILSSGSISAAGVGLFSDVSVIVLLGQSLI